MRRTTARRPVSQTQTSPPTASRLPAASKAVLAAGQAGGDGGAGAAEQPGRLLLRLPLQVAQEQRRPVPLRQPAQLLIQHAAQVGTRVVLPRCGDVRQRLLAAAAGSAAGA